MATPMSFQSLNFGDIPGQEREARRRYYDSLSSIGGVIKDTGKEYEAYLARKKAEEDEKRKWDDMIAEQEYRKQQDELARKYQAGRDEIADTRYEDELDRKLKEIESKKSALETMKKRVGSMYDERRINEMYGYGSPVAIQYHALMSANDFDVGQTAYNNFAGAIAQHDQMKLMREQANLDRVPNKSVTQINDSLSREGIDLRTIPKKVNEKKQRVVDVDAAQRQIDVIDEQLRKLETLEPNDNVSAKRTELLRFRSTLQDAMVPGYKEPTPTLADLLLSR